MQCKDCKLWTKREIRLKESKKKKKAFYPAGRCLNSVEFGRMFTVSTTNCNCGVSK